tara:strand:+ start:62 stop:307 length:246 start_codon:yes stop_codon:yes gene_type:complete
MQVVTIMKDLEMTSLKKALVRGTVILIPTYAVAYLTDKMIYVVPMLAAMGFVAASLFDDEHTTKRLDDDSYKDYKDDGDSE